MYHVAHQTRSFKVLVSISVSHAVPERKGFKVTESLYYLWLTKQEVLKFRCLHNISGSPAERKSIKVTEAMYYVRLTK